MSCPSSIRRRDSNPRPLDHEPPPITTRPGLPPKRPYSWEDFLMGHQQPLLSLSSTFLKADSHYCVFRVRLRQTVAFLQGDRKFPISALMQPTAEMQIAASSVNQP